LLYKPEYSTFIKGQTLVEYENIIAYDSVKRIFQLNEKEWQIINNNLPRDYTFVFGIFINETLIYKLGYGNFLSYTDDDLIKFKLTDPNYLIIDYNSGFEKKLANDNRIINILSKGNKIKNIDLQ
jgi:hypothetical protein